jgi:hypothetical protein
MLKSIQKVWRELDQTLVSNDIQDRGFGVLFLFCLCFCGTTLLVVILHLTSLLLTGESLVAPLYPFLR